MMGIKIHSTQNVQFLGFLRVAETTRRRNMSTTGLMNRFGRYIPSIFRFFFQRLVTTTAAHPQEKSFETNQTDDSSSSSSRRRSDSWRSVKLTEQQELVLNAISNGESVFITGSAGTEFSKDDVPKLFPRNQDVKLANGSKLKSLGGEIVKYRALDTGSAPWKSQLKQGIAPEELEICLGARVMLIKNLDLDNGLVNGAIGTVTDFVEQGGLIRRICSNGLLPIVRFDMGKEMTIEPKSWDVMEGDTKLATRKQVPFMLAWALSIHKYQGMTLDCLHTDLSSAFGCGMVYVALSRVRNLKGLHLSGFKASKIKAHPKVLDFYYLMHQNQLQ